MVIAGLWLPTAVALADSRGDVAWVVGCSLGGLALLSTLMLGGALGYSRRWRELASAVLAGTCSLLWWYLVAMVIAPDPTNTNDDAAGVGVVLFALPTFVIIALLLGLAAGAGRLLSRRRIRSAPLATR